MKKIALLNICLLFLPSLNAALPLSNISFTDLLQNFEDSDDTLSQYTDNETSDNNPYADFSKESTVSLEKSPDNSDQETNDSDDTEEYCWKNPYGDFSKKTVASLEKFYDHYDKSNHKQTKDTQFQFPSIRNQRPEPTTKHERAARIKNNPPDKTRDRLGNWKLDKTKSFSNRDRDKGHNQQANNPFERKQTVVNPFLRRQKFVTAQETLTNLSLVAIIIAQKQST